MTYKERFSISRKENDLRASTHLLRHELRGKGSHSQNGVHPQGCRQCKRTPRHTQTPEHTHWAIPTIQVAMHKNPL